MRIIVLLFFLFPILGYGGDPIDKESWVDSVYNQLSLKEKIGQLMMIRAHSNLGAEHEAKVLQQVKDFGVGGLCFFQGTPEKQAELTNRYQASAKIPLLISMDAEWGLGMRLKENSVSFPYQLTLGAIQDNKQLYDMGVEVGRQLRRLGVHVNFAPVADVNNNPNNPVINFRSFGEDRFQVAAKSYLYMYGMQQAGVIACAKHFPGHGDTDVDSHLDLPVISHDLKHLDSLEMSPFKILIDKGIKSVMVAHLHVPAIDNTPNLPTTLSSKAVNEILRKKMGFDGLVFTDGLGMKGVTKHFPNGEVEAKALEAGNDVLLLPQDLEAAFRSILEYIKNGKIPMEQLEGSVKRILAAKYDAGLTVPQKVSLLNLRKDLNSEKAKRIKRSLYQKAITLVRDSSNLVPIRLGAKQKIASLAIGAEPNNVFQNRLKQLGPISLFQCSKKLNDSQRALQVNQLKDFDQVIVSLHDLSNAASKDFGISESDKKLLMSLNRRTQVILTVFGNPYSLRYLDQFSTVLIAYEEDDAMEDLVAQALYGVSEIGGKLPVTASNKSKYLNGIDRPIIKRLGYGQPEEVDMDSKVLNGIDDLVKDAIAKRATPGAVVLVAKEGKIIFEKSFGHHTYNKSRKTSSSDLFDLASVTKILGGTLAIMKLHEDGVLNIYDPLRKILPSTKGTNKADLSLQDIMAHRAQLRSWIKFYEQTISDKSIPLNTYYQKKKTTGFSLPVTERLYLKDSFRDSIYNQIIESDLRSTPGYKYSDLGFYLVAEIVRYKTGKSIDQYLTENFYIPMGLEKLTYNPWKNYSRQEIPPTEIDKYFRRQTVWGYVHDMGAAMLGGVSGHAGLFGTAHDVAVIMQMILNNGEYGGQRYLDPETIRLFNNRHPSCTRRGIGFDMKELDASKSQNVTAACSNSTFGHLGFTGTCVWADPEHDLIYVFLSNRTYPSMSNFKLNKEDYRPRIQNIIYEAMSSKPSAITK